MSGNVVDLPLELALIRWAVVHRNWHELSGAMPVLTAFLAGWCSRCIGLEKPSVESVLVHSFRAGWNEADSQIVIALAKRQHSINCPNCRQPVEFVPEGENYLCDRCGVLWTRVGGAA